VAILESTDACKETIVAQCHARLKDVSSLAILMSIMILILITVAATVTLALSSAQTRFVTKFANTIYLRSTRSMIVVNLGALTSVLFAATVAHSHPIVTANLFAIMISFQ
jgi:hypothetical protein